MAKRRQVRRKVPATRKSAAASPDLKKQNADLRGELTEARAQQAATAEVLKVISRSTFDLQTVLDTLVESAAKLCEADRALVFRRQGETYHLSASHGFSEQYRQLMNDNPIAPGRGTLIGRTALEGHTVHIPDVLADPEYTWTESIELGGIRTLLGIPLLRDGTLIGIIALNRSPVRPFTDKQIELVTTFADQAVIAIENTRLFDEVQARTKELTESLEQQTATSEVLQVISSSQGELDPVFNAMLENAVRSCGAQFGTLTMYDGSTFQNVALHNVPQEFAEAFGHTFRPHPESGLAITARTKQIAHTSDLRTQPPYLEGDPAVVAIVDLAGARTILNVPMLKEGRLVGAISIFRQEVRPFTDKQIELVTNFAAQAVIAIENVRLLNELRESLQQQTATSEVLSVISSSPGDLEPVFKKMLENATRVCDAGFGNLMLCEGDGFRNVAIHTAVPALAAMLRGQFYPFADPEGPLGRAALSKKVVHVHDLRAEAPYRNGNPPIVMLVDVGRARTVLAVPLLKESKLLGAAIIYRTEVRPFTDKQIELVENFAKQAVIAIENVRLLKELRDRTTELAQSVEELRALGEVSQAVNSTVDLETVLTTIVSRATQLSNTDAGAIYVFDDAKQEFRLRATYGMDDKIVAEIKDRHIHIGETAIGEAVERRVPIQIPDVQNDPSSLVLDVIVRAGFRAVLIVPLLGAARIVGALVVRRKQPGAFPENIVDLLKTFAAQSVLAIQNAHLFTEIDEKSRQLEIASQHKSQFLANMSHELRTPLNAILGYTELILDNIYGETPEKMREVLDRLQANGKHLLGLINDVLDLSKIEAGELTLDLADYSLKEVVHTVFTAVESLATGKKLALTIDVAPNLPRGHGDERRLVQVLLNLVGNAIKFTDNGEVAIKATMSDRSFTVAVRDTGPGIAPSDQGKIFGEFQQADNAATKRKGGTGLGLSIAKRIIAMHGGRIWVESDVGKGSKFAFTIPVKVEQQVSEP